MLGTLALGSGCDRPASLDAGRSDAGQSDAGCAPVRELGKRALDRLVDINGKAPPPDAPLAAAAAHAESLAKATQEIGADFTRAAPRRRDLAESAEGVRMLGDLSAQKLSALARTVHDLDARLTPLTRQEGAANDAVDALGKDVAGAVGCDKAATAACSAVVARVKELEGVRVPGGFAQAAKVAHARAETLDGLAQAVEALPAAPPRAKEREQTVQRARAAATAFRGLAEALGQVAPLQEKLGKDREQAEEAMTRLAAELEAASEACGGPKAAGSAAASAAPSAQPPAPPPTGSAKK